MCEFVSILYGALLLYVYEACCILRFHASISTQCVVESCASHLHHSQQFVSPHQVVTLEVLVGGKEMKHITCTCSTIGMNNLAQRQASLLWCAVEGVSAKAF